MKWLTDIFSGATGGFMDGVSNLIGKFVTTDKDKQAFILATEKLLQQRDAEIEQTIRAELEAKTRIIEAEMQQDDNYTKRARPTVVYFGLVVIAINHVLVPNLIQVISQVSETAVAYNTVNLPTEFWIAWGGICSAWVIGRSAEKRGNRTPVIQTITGTKPKSLFE
ncbi:Uncharacterised protein [BD1-7 clade bacterium]|uniref:Holin of 3TMs, for gene-transfer release n=1 Tax=BD1-7 clade bacterium TaxID=2029982 RepID=A0A5S9P333_9GAMM|nr:Uncharacterised protein [BD1-7 clade bacterium]CAA0122885.1 Uncharacterised protein [BD1-7 clade bacterium]